MLIYTHIYRYTQHMFDASGFFFCFLFIILGSKSSVFEPGNIDQRTCEDKQETVAVLKPGDVCQVQVIFVVSFFC